MDAAKCSVCGVEQPLADRNAEGKQVCVPGRLLVRPTDQRVFCYDCAFQDILNNLRFTDVLPEPI